MKTQEYTERFLHWASGGALSASIAFIVFVPTLDNVNCKLQDASISLFVLSIPFLAAALARYKEYELKNTEGRFKGVSHMVSALFGFVCMILGFFMVLAAIDLKHLVTFVGAIFFLLLVEGIENLKSKRKS